MIFKSTGFSIVETMIALAIAGVLCAVAVPSYEMFVMKMKQSHAVASLAAIYKAEMIFRAEYDSFTTRMDAMGFQPNGTLHFNFGFNGEFSPPNAPQGSMYCSGTCRGNYYPVSCPNVTWTCAPSAGHNLDASVETTASVSTFLVNAHAHWESATNGESFFMDENKTMTHIPNPMAL